MTDYLKLYKAMAADGKQFRGLTIVNNEKQIGKLIREVGAKTILDYGCGAGDAYRQPVKLHHKWGIARQNVTLYDPSFPAHSGKPMGKFDVVVCSDVLEHVPEDQVEEFVKTLYSHADKAVWASVCCRPAKKTFPGTDINLHCTVRPFDWWSEIFTRHAEGQTFVLVESP